MEQSTEEKYRFAFGRSRPAHAPFDEFSLRHPKMPPGQRAKIFAPFSALRGFDEAVGEKLERYVDKRELSDEERERLDRTLAQLHQLTRNRRMARANHVVARVSYYVPCPDENHEAYGLRGSYKTLTGVVWRVDPGLGGSLQIADAVIELGDLAAVEILGEEEEN